MTRPLRLLHLYPRQLGINGDAGNVMTLAKRAEWRGVAVEVHAHDVGDDLAGEPDLVHIGSGSLDGQRAVAGDVDRIAGRLRDWRESGIPFVAISAGWHLLGREVVDVDGWSRQGAGVFDSRCVVSASQTVGETVVRTADGTLAGFENHASVVTIGGDPLGSVVRGGGNTPDAEPSQRREGMRVGESVASHLHGPLLAMNPALADRLLAAALRRGDPDAVLPHPIGNGAERLAAVDLAAARAREAIAARLRVRV